MSRQGAEDIIRTLQEHDYTAYLAGGCVRDHLLGIEPKDFDIATSARPEEVQRLFERTYAVGAAFGVIVVLLGEAQYEVATFRTDGAYVDGRRPTEVVYSSPEEDAQRRDFTINGMFRDPLGDEIIDYVGGQDDLRAGVIRAIGDPEQRFAEDKLRILRAIRFAARFDYEIEPRTWEALCGFREKITAVSAERIRDELVKIFTHPSRVRGLDLLDAGGLIYQVIPELRDLKGCEQPPQFHPEGDVYTHTRIMLELLPAEPVSVPLAFGVLLHDIGKPPTQSVDETGRIRFNTHEHVGARMTERIMKRLRFSNREIDETVALVDRHMMFKDVKSMRTAKLKRFMDAATFEDEMELHRVDCRSSHGMLDNYEFLREKKEEFENEPTPPEPLITGNDLIEMGLQPGPRFKEILEGVRDQQLENTLTTREDALDWVRRNYPPET
jgi:poly(A) polymerase